MSKQSDSVKRWRKLCKTRIIESMGGRCCVCNYNKCDWSLALHHLDPSQKDFSFGKIRANPKNWESIVLEIRKCVLVCHNCHSEIHAGVTSVPLDAPRFNEKFFNYRDLKNTLEEVLSPCPICGKLKSIALKNCSLICSGKSQYKVNWDLINLVEELKNKSIVKLAKELGCSDAAVHKRLKKLGLK